MALEPPSAAAARPVDAAAQHVGIGIGVVAPVHFLVEHGLAVADGDVYPRIAVARTGLQQADGMRAVLAQPVGQHASGRTGAHHDVVHCVRHAALPGARACASARPPRRVFPACRGRGRLYTGWSSRRRARPARLEAILGSARRAKRNRRAGGNGTEHGASVSKSQCSIAGRRRWRHPGRPGRGRRVAVEEARSLRALHVLDHLAGPSIRPRWPSWRSVWPCPRPP